MCERSFVTTESSLVRCGKSVDRRREAERGRREKLYTTTAANLARCADFVDESRKAERCRREKLYYERSQPSKMCLV